mgnify:CR=1 FL=1
MKIYLESKNHGIYGLLLTPIIETIFNLTKKDDKYVNVLLDFIEKYLLLESLNLKADLKK